MKKEIKEIYVIVIKIEIFFIEDFKELLNEIWKILKKSKYWFKYNKKSFKKIEETSKRALSIKKLFKKREKEKNLNSI